VVKSLALLLVAALLQSDPPHDRQDIPDFYRGTWALSRAICKEERGPAFVTIGARTIDFYERHGYLDLAQLNHVSDTPAFYGHFRFVSLLNFSDEPLRLERNGDNLLITEGDVDTPTDTAAWYRCPKI